MSFPTDPGAGRPPVVPPTRVGLGGGSEDEDPRAGALIAALMRLVEMTRKADAVSAGDVEMAGVLQALDGLSRENPASRDEVIAVLKAKRADLGEQLELERLVARPPRKGYELIREEDDRPVAIEKTIAFIDRILALFRATY